MVQIPDAIRPYTTALRKLHFWILAALAPLVLLPLLLMAQATISSKIKTQRSKIEGALSSVEAIFNNRPHPNEKWATKISGRARQINDETLRVWDQLWQAQQPLRQWPESLGKSFVKAASSLKANQSLSQPALEVYQNGIKRVVRELPERMGADDLMSDAAAAEGMRAPLQNPRDRDQQEEPSPVQWTAEDQQELFLSFDWEEPPSTTQVVMAQEELWMYGVLCDVIRNVNRFPVGAGPEAVITSVNIPIPVVQELKVGYPAAEDDPGGRASQRILRFQPASEGGLAEGVPLPGESMGGADGGAAIRPAHPRFGGRGRGEQAGAMGMSPGGSGDEFGGSAADVSPEDALRNWVYVDLDGNPLTAADLAATPTSQIFRLMPFVLRATIDQRAIDRLLVDLASAPVPIDTRQVRINSDQSLGGEMGGRGRPSSRRPARFGGPSAAENVGEDRARLHDVSIEVRGTLAIVMPPNPAILKVGDDDDPEEASE